jgi:hypothetical protein
MVAEAAAAGKDKGGGAIATAFDRRRISKN